MVFYLTQLLVDFAAAKFVDKIGYRTCVVSSQVLSAAGLILMAVLPEALPVPFIGILTAVVLYAVGSGLIEVLVSPIVEACPFENKDGMMSLLHSFYCWGAVGVILGSTLFFTVFGIANWKILAVIWALVPLYNTFNFISCPIERLVEDGKSMRTGQLLRLPLFWLLIVLMICAGASEASMAQWASAFTESAMGVSKTVGDLAGPCLFAVFMGISRILYGKMSEKLDLTKTMLACGVLMRDLLSDGIIGIHAGFWAGRLCALRRFSRNNVAGDHQYFSTEVSERQHGNVSIFGFGGRFGRYGQSRNGRRHFQYVWR